MAAFSVTGVQSPDSLNLAIFCPFHLANLSEKQNRLNRCQLLQFLSCVVVVCRIGGI